MRTFLPLAPLVPLAAILLVAGCSTTSRVFGNGGSGGTGTTTSTTGTATTTGSGGTSTTTTGPGGMGGAGTTTTTSNGPSSSGSPSSSSGSPSSSSGNVSSSTGSSGCVSKSCTDLGLQCGMATDNCNKPIDCGDCATGDVCGATAPNQCGTSAACTSYASNICNTYQACAPDVVTAEYGSVNACEARWALFCALFVSDPQDSWTQAQAQSCGSALATLGSSSCPSFLLAFVGAPPASCKPAPGPRPDGMDCIDSGQCASAYCKHAAGSWCGACAALSGSGGACTTYNDCQSGLACVSGTCTTAVQAGGACTIGDNQCALGLYCQGSPATCKLPLELNDACTLNTTTCDPLKLLYCNSATGTCERFQSYAAAGQTCGISGDMLVACSAAAICSNLLATGSTCIAPAADNAACNLANNVGCTNPAACVQGTCALPTPQTCP